MTENTPHDKIIPLKPCFPYAGGKTKLLSHILPRIPEHKRYVEAFAGGLAVLLNKERSQVEVVNDYSSDVANFYRYVRYHKEALLEELCKLQQSREMFNEMKNSQPITDLQRATRWYYLQICSVQAAGSHFGRSRERFHGIDMQRHGENIARVSERLRRVYVENKDFQEVVSFWDSKETFVYLDPPYVECNPSSYKAFDYESMSRLETMLGGMQSSWMVSCDASDFCRNLFAHWECVELEVSYASKNRSGKHTEKDKELLVLSPEISNKMRKSA